MTIREKLAKRAKKAGLTLQTDVISALEAYFELLQKWNLKVSLTSLRVSEAGEEAIDRLLIEPLLAAEYLASPSAIVMDVGSGGGSPAIPMKIFKPGIAMRMVESKTRKAAFLREVVRQLNLPNTTVEAARFEELLVRPELHEGADAVTMRAVRAERKTLMGLQAFLRPGGQLFLFRTGSMTGEQGLVNLPLTWERNVPLLPHLDSRLAVFRKSSSR
jgi:16S rRNA (guanine527-N7)-methyltransferase